MAEPKLGPSTRGNAGKGRKKGSKNKVTASIKAAICEAFEQMGGVESLVKWGSENPNLFYPVWSRLAPQEHDITSNGKTLEALVAGSRRSE